MKRGSGSSQLLISRITGNLGPSTHLYGKGVNQDFG